MNIRKLIREELEKIIDKKTLEHKFDKDILYLKGFSLNKKEDKGNFTVWIFDHKEKDYTLRFYIAKNKERDNWSAKVYVYWKIPSKELTNAKGKDFELPFGPYDSYEELVKDLNRKLINSPTISADNYMDNDNTQFNKDLVIMSQMMLKHGDKIMSVKDKHFDGLKKLYNQVKDIKTLEELQKFIDDKAPDEEDKQMLLLTIQRVYQLDFYLAMEEMKSLF